MTRLGARGCFAALLGLGLGLAPIGSASPAVASRAGSDAGAAATTTSVSTTSTPASTATPPTSRPPGSTGAPPSTTAAPIPRDVPPKLDAAPVDFARGHADLAVLLDGSALRAAIKDGREQPPTWRTTGAVRFVVADVARVVLPDLPGFGFLGRPGDPVWLLPQTENPELPWLGWSTETIGANELPGGALDLTIESVRGPGALAVFFEDSFGLPIVLFDSDGSSPPTIAVPTLTHAHANWAFSAPGTYQLRLRWSAPGVTSAPFDLRLDVAKPATPGSTTTVAAGTGGSTSTSTAADGGPVDSGALAGADTETTLSRLADSGSRTTNLALVGLVLVGIGALGAGLRGRRRIV